MDLANNNSNDTTTSTNYYPLSYDPSFKDAQSPLKTTDTFHTATSACSDLNCNGKMSNIMCDSGVDLIEQNKIKNRNCLIDESDLSSSEDYKVQSDQENSAHSSSSLEKVSPFNQVKRKFRTKQIYKYGHNIKQDDINTLKYLNDCITKQKVLIMKNYETNCSAEDLDKQISVSKIRKLGHFHHVANF